MKHSDNDDADQNNPGQATGIISVLIAFVGLVPIGFVLSIISISQSKKANQPVSLGIMGLAVNLIALLAFGFLIMVIAPNYSDILHRAQQSDSKQQFKDKEHR